MSFLVSPLPAVPSCPGGSVSGSNGRKVVGEGPCLILEAAPGKYHEGFQLGCRQSCCHDLVLSCPRGPTVSLPWPRGVPHRVISAARVSPSAPWPVAEDRPQDRHFQHLTSSWNSPSAQPLMVHLWLLQQEIISILQRGKLRHGEEKKPPASFCLSLATQPLHLPRTLPAASPSHPDVGRGMEKQGIVPGNDAAARWG